MGQIEEGLETAWGGLNAASLPLYILVGVVMGLLGPAYTKVKVSAACISWHGFREGEGMARFPPVDCRLPSLPPSPPPSLPPSLPSSLPPPRPSFGAGSCL
jgi:hypothetical protein